MKTTVMTGLRPTGRLHIGHLYGALSTIATLSHQGDCFVEIADLHALTTGFGDVSSMRSNVSEIVVDFIAAGIDISKAVIFRQSAVPEIGMIHVLLSMITPQGMLRRMPSYKDMISHLDQDGEGEGGVGYGFLGYPLLQTADIIAVGGAGVPVGRDQEPHLEMAREVVRKFNFLYGDTLIAPRSIATEHPSTPGLDMKKMSKSYANTIDLADDETTTIAKMKTAYTDPSRLRKTDPGHPEGCAVAGIHRVVSPTTIDLVEAECRAGERGCVGCKLQTADKVNEALAPIRARRATVETGEIENVLELGEITARARAAETLNIMRTAMNLA